MFLIIRLHVVVTLCAAALATVSLRRAGWLDRVVAYYKNNFYKDVDKYAPIKISAEIRPKPAGYVDSKQWDYDSVIRLLTLIRQSENALPVQKVLRRMLQPTRRIMMSMKDSMKHFPSLTKHEKNTFYYDVEYTDDEYESEVPPPPAIPEDEVVLVVSNPVEARLPSARISVKLLREILIARASAARQMPSTAKSTIPWKPMNKTQATPAAGGDTAAGGDGGGDAGDGTPAAGAAGGDAATGDGAGDVVAGDAGDGGDAGQADEGDK